MKELLCTKNRLFFTPTMKLSLHFIVMSLFCVSCGNSSKKSSPSMDSQMEASIIMQNSIEDSIEDITEDITEDIDIPIAINLSHTEDEDMKQLVDAEYEVIRETDKDMYIDINSDYYKEYFSGHRFMASQLAFFEHSENVEYLTMDLDIVNNTNERLNINELNIIVDESIPDTLPVIYICTTENYSNCIYFVNESWFNWKGFTFSYSILSKDESFDGKYKKHRHITFFDKYAIIDLLPDMKEMGYNYEELVNCIRNRNIRFNRENNTDWDTEPIDHDEDAHHLTFYINSNDDEFAFFQEKFRPFELREDTFNEYVGTASLYGSIKFDNSDFVVDFIADISLSTSGGFGALSYANDKFDVELKSFGNDYELRYPYTTVIEPYGAEMIKLTVNADKSSSHKFYVDVKNGNGLKIRSKNIHFHHYYPKN